MDRGGGGCDFLACGARGRAGQPVALLENRNEGEEAGRHDEDEEEHARQVVREPAGGAASKGERAQ